MSLDGRSAARPKTSNMAWSKRSGTAMKYLLGGECSTA